MSESEEPSARRGWFEAWARSLSSGQRGMAFVLTFVVLEVLFYLVLVWAPVLFSGRRPDWEAPAGPIFGGLVGVLGYTWWQRRRVGAMLLPELTRALRTGRLPQDADPSVWRPLLTRDKRAWRRFGLLLQAFLGFVVLTTVVLGSALERSWRLLIPALILVAAVAGLIQGAMRRRDRRTDELLQQLDARL